MQLFHGWKEDRKYLLWSAAGEAVFAFATVGTFFPSFVQVKTQVESNNGAWQKKTSKVTQHRVFPFTPGFSDKSNPSNRKLILSLYPWGFVSQDA